jgi:uncharacterized protein
MMVSGTARLPASQEMVWAALADAGLLVRAVPGLDRLDAGAGGGRQFLVTTSIAAVSGSYGGEAVVVERAEPGRLALRVVAAGAKGKVTADVTLGLAPAGDDATELSYAVDADVEGAIAGIGHLMLAGIAKRLAADAIGGLGAALAGTAPAVERPANEPADQEPAVADRAAVDEARRGIGLGGERVPGLGQVVPRVSPGVLAGAAAGVAAIVLGVILARRRSGR